MTGRTEGIDDPRADRHRPPAGVGLSDAPISRAVILQTALAILDRDGESGLSMRRLSEALNRDPTVIYRHVPNKGAVLDGVAEIILSQLAVDSADTDWVNRIRLVAHDFRRLAIAHPNAVPLLVTRPLATPLGQRPAGMLRPIESVLTLLTSAGFTGVDALHIYRVIFGYLHGHRAPVGLAPPAHHRLPPAARAGTRPRLLRRRRRTRSRPRHPPQWPDRDASPLPGLSHPRSSARAVCAAVTAATRR
jgi:AcrR family transcriptional regulator